MQNLSDAAIAARRAYQKQWRQKNPDKVRRNNASYWERRAERKKQSDNAGGENDGKTGVE